MHRRRGPTLTWNRDHLARNRTWYFDGQLARVTNVGMRHTRVFVGVAQAESVKRWSSSGCDGARGVPRAGSGAPGEAGCRVPSQKPLSSCDSWPPTSARPRRNGVIWVDDQYKTEY